MSIGGFTSSSSPHRLNQFIEFVGHGHEVVGGGRVGEGAGVEQLHGVGVGAGAGDGVGELLGGDFAGSSGSKSISRRANAASAS